MIAPGKYIIFR